MTLPAHFCWTRFGIEAGEGVAGILARKEKERIANTGVFLWGIGNAIGPSIRKLLLVENEPEVAFSLIRSPAKALDTNPEVVVRWTTGRDLDGHQYELPLGSVVTSAYHGPTKQSHYALVCSSEVPIRLDPEGEQLEFDLLRNLA